MRRNTRVNLEQNGVSTMENDPQIEAAGETTTEVEVTETVELIDEQLLVEDVSIDGMCGVY